MIAPGQALFDGLIQELIEDKRFGKGKKTVHVAAPARFKT